MKLLCKNFPFQKNTFPLGLPINKDMGWIACEHSNSPNIHKYWNTMAPWNLTRVFTVLQARLFFLIFLNFTKSPKTVSNKQCHRLKNFYSLLKSIILSQYIYLTIKKTHELVWFTVRYLLHTN